jgi:hypothetical protein
VIGNGKVITMFQALLSTPYVPFALALGLLLALLGLELIALLLGGSLLGSGDADAPDVAGPEAQFDFAPDAEPDVGALLEASVAMEAPDQDLPDGSAGWAGLIGLGHTPFMIWLAALLMGFGLSGLILQSVVQNILGAPLGTTLAVLIAAVIGLGFARTFARFFGNLLPQIETTATSAQFMGGLRGVVTQGTARNGQPAEVRLRDRHGNTHYLRCEPFRDTDIIPEGTEVLTLRERLANGGWGLRILPLD